MLLCRAVTWFWVPHGEEFWAGVRRFLLKDLLVAKGMNQNLPCLHAKCSHASSQECRWRKSMGAGERGLLRRRVRGAPRPAQGVQTQMQPLSQRGGESSDLICAQKLCSNRERQEGGNVDPANLAPFFDAPSIGNIRGCSRSSMGGKHQAGLLRRGEFPCRQAGGMTSFVLTSQPLMVNT